MNLGGYKYTETWPIRLADRDAGRRREARQELVRMGEAALPVLSQKLSARDWHVRWEAAKALGEIGGPKAAELLVGLLQDDDTGVRWAAMGSLIEMERGSLRPMFESLTRDFHSARVREGSHHVLRILLSRGKLTESEKEVFYALKGAAPGIQAAWAANRALMESKG